MASEIGLKKQRAGQLMRAAIKERRVPNLITRDGVQVLYSETMVNEFVRLYKAGQLTKRTSVRISPNTGSRHAALTVAVPVFDKQAADILVRLFGGEGNIQKEVMKYLESKYKPVMQEFAELEASIDNAKKAILEKIASGQTQIS